MRPRYLSQSHSWSALGQLPEHRRAITGRTQSSAFEHEKQRSEE